MSDADNRWTIRDVDNETRKGITALAKVHRCTVAQIIRAMYRKMLGLPFDDTKTMRDG